MYAIASEDEIDEIELDELEPGLLPIGVELRPGKMRPSVWVYEDGESGNRHYQREQEELYVPLSGRFEIAIETDGDGSSSGTEESNEDSSEAKEGNNGSSQTADGDDLVEIEPGDYLVVEPAAERHVSAIEGGRLLVVGAPATKDDGVRV